MRRVVCLIFIIYLSSCSEIYFTDVQTAGGRRIFKLPKELRGQWQSDFYTPLVGSFGDQTLFTTAYKENNDYDYENRRNTIDFDGKRVDYHWRRKESSLKIDGKYIGLGWRFKSPGPNENIKFFKSGDFYIVNHRAKDVYWNISVIKPNKNGDIQLWLLDDLTSARLMQKCEGVILEKSEFEFDDGWSSTTNNNLHGLDRFISELSLEKGSPETGSGRTLNPNIDSALFQRAVFSGLLSLNNIENITSQIEPIILKKEGAVLIPNTKESYEQLYIGGSVVEVENIKNIQSDVDQNIPQETKVNDKTFALVIGNENYKNEIKVDYALNDARVFKSYVENTLGVPKINIRLVENGSYGELLGHLKWMNDVIKAYNGQAKVIVYYAGHGMPDPVAQSSFLLPIDGNSQNSATAIPLSEVYSSLTQYPSESVTVFLDACFSGASRDNNGNMLAQGRGVKYKPKTEVLSGNIVVFSATSGDETAYPYKDKQHGLFTYFLLKKLQESKGDVMLDELNRYLTTQVSQISSVVYKPQNPMVACGSTVLNTWGRMKLK